MMFLIPILFSIIHYSLCETTHNKALFVKGFPKKVLPGFRLHHLAGNYVKPASSKRAPNNVEAYTTFPKPFQIAGKSRLQVVPDSPYFTADLPHEEHRSRVKKMLFEDFSVLRRSKRNAEEVKVEATTDATKVEKVSVKSETADLERADASKQPVNPVNAGNLTRRLAQKSNKSSKVKSKAPRTNTGKKIKRVAKRKPKVSNGRVRVKNNNGKKQLKRPAAASNKKSAPVRSAKNKKRNNAARSPKLTKPKSNRSGSARRLIAGKDALIEQYPYVVSIQKDDQHWCAGALLNPRLVISTANCFWRSKSISRMRVRAGSRHTARGGQSAQIQEVMKHPGWKLRRNPDNDIALVVLTADIKFSHTVHSVDLPNRVMMPAFDDAWVTSWGAERRDGIFDSGDKTLQVYYARLMQRDKCNNVTQRFGVTVTDNFICLAQTGKRAPCTRDTGAPAVSDGVLWGLASWGIRRLCGTARYPAVFSYIASQSNMDFITNATRLLMGEERFNPYPDRFPVLRVAETNFTVTQIPAVAT